MRYGIGDVIFLTQDALRPNHCHTSSAVAVTPVELLRVERWRFLHAFSTLQPRHRSGPAGPAASAPSWAAGQRELLLL